tara:strand:- start:44 stop:469 length:426 start_codon:yes stop_codon:yes gene_type:complete
MRGPGIPAGTTCSDLIGTIDLLPTFASLTGKSLAGNKKIDGIELTNLLTGDKNTAERDEFLHYTSQGEIEGIRQGKWKLLRKKQRKGNKPEALFLFDLEKDLGEQNNLAEQKTKKVGQLTARMYELDAEIERNARSPWLLE